MAETPLTAEELVQRVRQTIDRAADRGVDGTSFEGHTTEFTSIPDLLMLERHAAKVKLASQGSPRRGLFGRRVMASFNGC